MILACIENIFSITKYNTVISRKVSSVITHPSQLTVEACSTVRAGLGARPRASGPSLPAPVWL